MREQNSDYCQMVEDAKTYEEYHVYLDNYLSWLKRNWDEEFGLKRLKKMQDFEKTKKNDNGEPVYYSSKKIDQVAEKKKFRPKQKLCDGKIKIHRIKCTRNKIEYTRKTAREIMDYGTWKEVREQRSERATLNKRARWNSKSYITYLKRG